jgi:hypothetical protein
VIACNLQGGQVVVILCFVGQENIFHFVFKRGVCKVKEFQLNFVFNADELVRKCIIADFIVA